MCSEEEAAQCRSNRHRAGFFLEKKRKKTWSDSKMGYDRVKFDSMTFQD